MTRRVLLWIGIAALAVAVAVAIFVSGGGSDGDPAGADVTGIPPQDPALVAVGEGLYLASCSACHGSDLRGTNTGPSHLSVVYEPSHHGDAAFAFAVRNGVRQHHWPYGDMAPVQGLSDDDIAAIVAFVREQQRIHGFEPYPPP